MLPYFCIFVFSLDDVIKNKFMRDLRLCAARDKKLFDRFIYWSEERRLRFDEVIRILSEEEFFICEQLVMRIVRRMIKQGQTASNGKKFEKPKYVGFLQT